MGLYDSTITTKIFLNVAGTEIEVMFKVWAHNDFNLLEKMFLVCFLVIV